MCVVSCLRPHWVVPRAIFWTHLPLALAQALLLMCLDCLHPGGFMNEKACTVLECDL